MTAMHVTVTNAGRAELINAVNTGTAPVAITHIAFGDAGYPVSPSQTSLRNELNRVSAIAGQAVAADTISVTAKDESSGTYTVREFGLFTEHGTLFAVYSQATPIIEKAPVTTLLLTIDVTLQDIDVGKITFGDVSFSNPPASETVAGVVRLSSAVDSPATDVAASSAAVKSANDNAETRLKKADNLSDLADKAKARSNLGLSSAATMSTTSSRTDGSTSKVLQAKAMNDHRISGDHDGRYVRRTGAEDLSGHYRTTGQVEAGRGGGSVAMTTNDGKGNANLTFNHRDGKADQDGNAGRIHVNTDETSNGIMTIQVKSGLKKGVLTDLISVMTLHQDVVNVLVALRRKGVDVVDVNRTIATGSGLTGGGNLNANRTLSVDSTVVRTSRAIGTSGGLTGGGNLSANRTISIAAKGVKAAHLADGASERDWVLRRVASAPVGVAGTPIVAYRDTACSPGVIYSGNTLKYPNGKQLTGSWRCMGYFYSTLTKDVGTNIQGDLRYFGLFVRER